MKKPKMKAVNPVEHALNYLLTREDTAMTLQSPEPTEEIVRQLRSELVGTFHGAIGHKLEVRPICAKAADRLEALERELGEAKRLLPEIARLASGRILGGTDDERIDYYRSNLIEIGDAVLATLKEPTNG